MKISRQSSRTTKRSERRVRRPNPDAPPAEPSIRQSMLKLVNTPFVTAQMGSGNQQSHEPPEIRSTPDEGDVHAADGEKARRRGTFGTTRPAARSAKLKTKRTPRGR